MEDPERAGRGRDGDGRFASFQLRFDMADDGPAMRSGSFDYSFDYDDGNDNETQVHKAFS